MLSFANHLTIVIVICAGCATSFASRIANKQTNLAQKRLENVHIRARGLSALLSRLSLSHEIPIGFEVALAKDDFALYRIDFEKGTVSDLLGQFVVEHPGYAWQIENEVVSIFPKDNYRDPILRELLSTEISSFSVKEKTSCAGFAEALVKTPEIARLLESYQLKHHPGYMGGFYIQQLGQKLNLDFSHITLKLLLDKVIKESPVAKIWIIEREQSTQTLVLELNAKLENAPKKSYESRPGAL